MLSVSRHAIVVASLWLSLALHSIAIGHEKLDPTKAKREDDSSILWYDIRALGMEGKGWAETLAPYDRLPAKAEKMVRGPVWGLSRNSAGMCVRFVTDAPTIQARWTLISKNLAMPHMPATGVSGLDLYVKTATGQWRWLSVGRPTLFPTNSAALVSGLPVEEREYLLYLPLYNGVSEVELGIPKGHALMKLDAVPPELSKPVLFYGTSITQGGCASRPGMVHTAILGRRLNRPVLNLGFSGNGKMEPEMATLFAELDPAIYVLDCLPNMTAVEVTERAEPFVQTLRKAHPKTPIVLVEDRTYANSFLVPSQKKRNDESRAALREVYSRLKSAGIENVHYLEGEPLLGDDSEGTVDGSHPTDLGFWRQADAMQPLLGKLLTP